MAAPSQLLCTSPEDLFTIAKSLSIVDHRTGIWSLWQPNFEQFKIFKALYKGKYVYFLKVRQIGASTAVLLDDCLWTAGNDALGQEVKCGVFIDSDDKAQEQKRRAVSFLTQLNIMHKATGNNIIFPNGSMMHFASAGGRRAGASITFQRLHLTELPFWRDATNSYSAIMQTLVLDGQCIIETTMGLDDPVAMNLWVDTNQYQKIFFPYEEHREYREEDPLHPDYPMSAEEETWLRTEGFTDPASMRYWLWQLRNKSANDVHKQFREYPQLPEHSFKFAEGRWCNVDPAEHDPIEEYTLPDVPGVVRIYRAPADCSHHLVLGCDTAGGLGLDRSVVAVVDGRDGFVCATYVSSEVKNYDLAKIGKSLQQRYTYHQEHNGSVVHRVPPIRVEVNGIGRGTAQDMVRLRCVVYEFDTNVAYKQVCMELTSRMVEQHKAYGPSDLAFESKQIRTKNGQFIGFKDLFMTLGFCYDWLERNRYKPLVLPAGQNTFNRKQRMKGKR